MQLLPAKTPSARCYIPPKIVLTFLAVFINATSRYPIWLREVIACGNAFSGKQLPGNVHVGDLFDPNYLLEPPLLAGCNWVESDQKLASNIYKSLHMTSGDKN